MPQPPTPSILTQVTLAFAAMIAFAGAQPAAPGAASSPGGATPPPVAEAKSDAPAAPPAESAPPEKTEFKLPGLVVNTKERSVDVDAVVCLEQGALEFIACTKDTKEHESIVMVKARPIHIHTALLLIGAKNGNPAMRRPLDKEGTRWVDLPPQGDPIEVFLVVKDAEGKMVERPISDFMMRRGQDEYEYLPSPPADQKKEEEEKEKFPNEFVFAGSLLGDPSKSPREYLAESSGHVISISTFGDEVICMPGIMGHENGGLVWQIDSTHLPKVDTEVILRLRPKKAKQ